MAFGEKRLGILNHYDIVQARQCVRQMAREMGFGLTDQTRIATAVSEVARQVLGHEGKGDIWLTPLEDHPRLGLECICLAGTWPALSSGPANGGILGGVERLVDEFKVEPRNGGGVAVVMRKWLQGRFPQEPLK